MLEKIDTTLLEIVDLFSGKDAAGRSRVRRGKFVAMRHEPTGILYLVLGLLGRCEYHADVVERFCALERFDIRGEMLAKAHLFLVGYADWSVAGGGFWEQIEGEERLRLHGSSQAYGASDIAEIMRLGKGKVTI